MQSTRDMAGRVWRSRVSRLASIWIIVALIEVASWRLFLSKSFYRDFFMPIAIVVVIVGLAASWRTLMRRDRDRRGGDRRADERREAPAQPD